MKSIRIKGTIADQAIDITVSSDVDPKAAAKFAVDFYEALIDEATESRIQQFMNKIKRINECVMKLITG